MRARNVSRSRLVPLRIAIVCCLAMLLVGIRPPITVAQAPATVPAVPTPLTPYAFWAACKDGNLAVVEQALAEKLDPMVPPKPGALCPFFQAVEHGHYDLIRSMLLAGVPVNAADPQGRTALSVACDGMSGPKGNNEAVKWIVRLLLRSGADVNAHQGAALTAACTHSFEFFKDLVDVGGKLRITDLIHAVKRDDLPLADFLIEKGGGAKTIPRNGLDLMLAVKSPAMLDRLVKLGFDFKAPEYQGGYVLYTHHGDRAFLDRFLALGFDVNATNAEGQTPLFERPMSDWLLSHGAKINARDHQGITPLMVAATNEMNGSEEVVEFLLGAGADPAIKDQSGRNVMEQSIGAGRWPAVLTLLQAKSVPENPAAAFQKLFADSLEGGTSDLLLRKLVKQLLPMVGPIHDVKVQGKPLMVCATFLNEVVLAENLIMAGADINATDDSGRTALMWAEILGAGRMKAILVENQANPTLRDLEGKSAADFARLAAYEAKGASNQDPYDDKSSPSKVVPSNPKGDCFDAIAVGDLRAVKALVKKEPAVLQSSRAGLRPLHLAISYRQKEIAAHLVASGASLMELDGYGRSSWHLAINSGSSEMLAWVFAIVPKEERRRVQEEAVALAMEDWRWGMLLQLYDQGWKPEPGAEAMALLTAAAKGQDLKTFKRILERYPKTLATFEPEYRWRRSLQTLLSEVVKRRDPAMLKAVIVAAPNPRESPVRDYLQEAFVDAVRFDSRNLFPVFIDELKFDPNELWTQGLLLNHIAPKDGKYDDEQFRLKSKLEDAILDGEIETIRELLALGAKVDGGDNRRDKVLVLAARRGDIEVFKLLLEQKANVDELDRESGETPLTYAVQNRRRDMVELLLAAGADPEIKNKSGKTALDMAREDVQDRTVQILEQWQAKLQEQ